MASFCFISKIAQFPFLFFISVIYMISNFVFLCMEYLISSCCKYCAVVFMVSPGYNRALNFTKLYKSDKIRTENCGYYTKIIKK